MAHFTYQSPFDPINLSQGDLLERSPELEQIIKEVHPHFARADNLYFFVLTQSCDLVHDRIKTDYIAICPVRTLTSVLAKALPAHVKARTAGVPIGVEKEKAKYTQFLERLFNNNEPGLFFLDSRDSPLGEDCCALTKLAISLKRTHYETCVEAKRLQLTEAFQAKLGWLIGSIYSKVGTQDHTRSDLQRKVSSALESSTIWLPTERERKAILDEAARIGDAFSADDIPGFLKAIPTPKDRVLAVVDRALVQAGIDARQTVALRKILKNDPELAQLLSK